MKPRTTLIWIAFVLAGWVWIAVAQPTPASADPPSEMGSMAPKLSHTGDGELLLSWLEPVRAEDGQRSSQMKLQFSRYDGKQWSSAGTIMQRDDFFANWADVPSVVAASDGTLLAHWLQKTGEGTYAYHIMLARSTNRGETWNVIGRAHEDQTATEHGFVSLVQEGNGIRAFWLDGRDMKMVEADSDVDHHDDHGGGNMTLRTTLISGDKIAPSEILDLRVCECSNTSAAVTATGPVIVYRDRSEQENRDIAIVRRVNGRWTDPRLVHEDGWLIPGCPVNGPAVAAHDNNVAVAWYTGAEGQPRVLLAFSKDGGGTFAEPIVIDENNPFGRVAIAISKEGHAIVCWMAAAFDGAAIKLLKVQPDGLRSEQITIARTVSSRAVGFPALALHGETAIVVWTNPGERLRAAAVPLEKLTSKTAP